MGLSQDLVLAPLYSYKYRNKKGVVTIFTVQYLICFAIFCFYVQFLFFDVIKKIAGSDIHMILLKGLLTFFYFYFHKFSFMRVQLFDVS